jgi:MFS family permease
MDLVLLGWLAFQLTDSPFMVGLAAFARSAPLMVLGPFTGILADRMHRGHVLIATQCLGLVTALALAAVFAAGRGGFGPLVGLEMLFGVLWALDFPARRTALYALVGPRRVATAVSLETVSMQVAKMVGPVLAGIELARLGPAPCYVGVAVLYVVGLLVFAGLPARIGGPGRRDTISMAASLGAGFREAWRQPTVRAVLIVTVMMNVLFFPYQHMLPVFAHEVLRVGPEWLGALVAARRAGRAARRAGHRGPAWIPPPRARVRALRPGRAVPAAGLHERALALGLPAAGADRGLRVGVRGDAEHPGAALGPRGQSGPRHGHPLRLHRHPAHRIPLDRLPGRRHRGGGRHGPERDDRAARHAARGVAPGPPGRAGGAIDRPFEVP